MALVKHSVLMAKSYCIPIFKVSYNVPIINIVLRFIMFYYYCFYVQPLKIVCRKINKNENVVWLKLSCRINGLSFTNFLCF